MIIYNIKIYYTNKNIAVAVGLAHFSGHTRILHLLENKGFIFSSF